MFIASVIISLIVVGIGMAARNYANREDADYRKAMLAYGELDRSQKMYTRAPEEPEMPSSIGKAIAALGVVMLLTSILVASTVVVSANEVGVPTTFGKIGQPIQSGVSVINPLTKVNKLPTRPVTVELSGDSAVRAATNQAGSYNVEISARWATDRANANKLYLQARTGDEDKISETIVAKSLRQAVNDVYSGFTNVEANELRATIAPQVSARLSQLMLPYGIDITDVNLRSSSPDDNVKASISSYAAEQQKTKTAEQAKLTAQAEAATRLATAKGIADAAKQTAGLSVTEQQAANQASWERAVKYAADKGVPLYTSPFGGSSTGVLVDGTAKK